LVVEKRKFREIIDVFAVNSQRFQQS